MANKIYDLEMRDAHDTPVTSVETDDQGIVKRAWDWVKNGEGGLINPSNLDVLIGRHITDLDDGFKARIKESWIS